MLIQYLNRLIKWLKIRLEPSLELKIYLLECKCIDLLKCIDNGQKVFYDNELVIECSSLITNHLVNRYRKYGQLTEFEGIVLDKIIKDGLTSFSFFLNSRLPELIEEREVLKSRLIDEGFRPIGYIGYFKTKIVKYVNT